MRKASYGGDVKLLKQIVYLLNRKAPLPLDQDENVDWGTDGQVYATDGTGGGKWVTPPAAQVQSDWDEADSTKADYIKNKPSDATQSTHGLMSSADKTKLDGIASGAEANVQSDWNEADSTSDAYIANKPTIPTVNDGTLTIQQNGTTVGTFSANQSGDTTVNLTGGGGSSYTAGDGINIDANNEISVDTAFTEASTRTNIASGDSLATIWGKIKKFFSDLKTVAFTGSYTDLSNQPTIPTNTNQLTNGAGFITSSGSCASATKATQDADGLDIRNKYVNIYNSWDIGRLSTVTVNDLANQGSAVAMINAATNNPIGRAGWVHVWSQAWRKGVNTSWVSQIALGAENSNGMWYRTGSGTIVDRAWKRVIDGSNLDSSVETLGYLKAPNVSEYEIASSASSSHKLTMNGYSAYGAADILISTRYSFGVIKITSDANNALSASVSMLIGASSISIAQSSAGVFTLAHGSWCAVTMVVFHKEWGGFTITIS